MAQHLALPRPTGPTVDDLPTYLGFGLLDRISARFEDGCLAATYSDEHDRVYEVRWNPDACALKSYWRGREIGRSGGPDLQKAFFYSWLGAEKSREDQRFVDLSNEIIHTGNVFFLFPRPEHVFFPSGLLFQLRQPIPARSLPAWEALKRTLELEAETKPRLLVHREGPGRIVHLLKGGGAWTEPVFVADLVVPLARLSQAVNQCIQSGIVPSGKHQRLVVSIGGGICWQAGDPRQQERAFAVVHDDELESAMMAAHNASGGRTSVLQRPDGGPR